MKCLWILLAALAFCFSAYAASDTRNGVWTAELQNDQLEVTIFHGENRGDRHNGMSSINGFHEPLSSFAGLSKDDLTGSGANVKFELRRPAGTIAFEGRAADGSAVGHYHFTPSDAFLRDLDSLGYRDFKDEMLIVFATTNFTPQTIRDLRQMGYAPSRQELEEIAIFEITPDFLREMARAGYPDLTLRDAVNFRVGRVDAAYIAQMRELGYDKIPAHKLADLAILGVTPKYIQEMKALGYIALSSRQLEDMRVFGITPDYIRNLSEKGYNNVPLEKLLQLRETGADKILFK